MPKPIIAILAIGIFPLYSYTHSVYALLGPLCEGAPPAGGEGENLMAARNISDNRKVLSLRPCGATSLAEGGKELHAPL